MISSATTATPTGQHPVELEDLVVTVVMARITDYFGFFVYGIASALVFPQLFFSNLAPNAGILASFALFALAFLMRPLGGLLHRFLQPRIGAPATVTIALLLMGTATVAIGLLPGNDAIGILAPTLLAFFRIIQGIGLGASWDGLTMQLKHAAPADKQGTYGMIPQLGAPIGFIVAAAMFYVLTGFLTESEFLQWGWRFAFFAVLGVNLVALFARLRLMTADLSLPADVMKSAPLKDLLTTQWKPILLSTFVPLASYALFHLVTIFPLGYIELSTGHLPHSILLVQSIGAAFAVLGVILSGVVADRTNRRTVVKWSLPCVGVIGLFIFLLHGAPWVFLLPAFAILGFAHGQAGAVVPNRFKPEYRYDGTAIATNLSWIVGAAFAPLVAMGLTQFLGLWSATLYLLSGVLASWIALGMLKNEE